MKIHNAITLRVFRFVISGAIAATQYSLMLAMLVHCGLSHWLAGIISYVSAMPISFLLHKFFTFESRAKPAKELPRFLATSGIGAALASLLPHLLSQSTRLSITEIGLVTSLVTPTATYALMSIWVFKQASQYE
jgi:putative flippase GtrA